MCKHGRVRYFACWARGLVCPIVPWSSFCFLFVSFLYSRWVLKEGMPRSHRADLQNGSILTGIGKKSTIIYVPKNMSGWISISVCLYSSFKRAVSIPEKRMTWHVYGVYRVLSFSIYRSLVHNGHIFT